VTQAAISVRGLHKRYGEFEAVRGIDLDVHPGEIFAFLGPNGAGKTTTVEILEGYRKRSDGSVSVLGVDPEHGDRAWRARIGIVLQDCRMEPVLTVRETLELYAGYYPRPRSVAETIELVGLKEKADTRAGALSGGQQRRLDLGVALIGDPDLIFLDEPTTGFDPAARRQAWEVIASLRELGKTIFLTTHYMDEAQWLADRVAVLARGRIVAEGTPDELGGRAEEATVVRFRLPHGVGRDQLPAELQAAQVTHNGEVVLSGADDAAVVRLLNTLTGWSLERGIELEGLQVTRPTLEDIYLRLVGQAQNHAPDGAVKPEESADAAAPALTGRGEGGERR
jgi:ABC-2 type transport system ATP-binding protein